MGPLSEGWSLVRGAPLEGAGGGSSWILARGRDTGRYGQEAGGEQPLSGGGRVPFGFGPVAGSLIRPRARARRHPELDYRRDELLSY